MHARGVGPPPIPIDQFSLQKLVDAIKFMLDPKVTLPLSCDAWSFRIYFSSFLLRPHLVVCYEVLYKTLFPNVDAPDIAQGEVITCI